MENIKKYCLGLIAAVFVAGISHVVFGLLIAIALPPVAADSLVEIATDSPPEEWQTTFSTQISKAQTRLAIAHYLVGGIFLIVCVSLIVKNINSLTIQPSSEDKRE